MFSKVGLLVAVFLIYMGYRWGSGKVNERQQNLAREARPDGPQLSAAQLERKRNKDALTLKILLGTVIVLLIVAILSSLQR